jgi:hypothetical protein
MLECVRLDRHKPRNSSALTEFLKGEKKMRICKRCRTNEAKKFSLNCEKCNERNRRYTAKLIAESNAKSLHIPVVSKSLVDYGAHGGLGNEWEKGVAGHLGYL